MKKLNFLYSEQPLDEYEIQRFEKEFEVTFPNNLRNLLLKFNGGVLDGKIEKYAFRTLSSINYGNYPLNDIIDDLQITEQHIPREEIPFADDQGGNVFTISTREEDYGKIYYWEMDVGEPRKNFVANSLEEFFGVDSFDFNESIV